MDYVNPLGFISQPNQAPNNPFWSGVLDQRNQNQGMPFVDQLQQSGQYDLMKKGMETGEFMGNEAQDMRSKERQAKTAEAESKIALEPVKTEAERKKIAEELRALPYMTDQKIEQARNIAGTLKSEPHRKLFSELGSLHEFMQDAPEADRPFLYSSAIKRWQTLHPDVQIPEEFKNYDPRMMPDLAAMRYSEVVNPTQAGKERITNLTEAGHDRRTDVHETHADYRAELGLEGHKYAADRMRERADIQETPQKAITRLRKELSKSPDQPEKMDEYKAHLEDQWNSQTQKDPGLTLLRIQSLTAKTPQQQEIAAKKYDQMRSQFFAEKGVYLNAPESGTIREGKGGVKYKFNGGFGHDPKDKKNWEQVK